VLAAKKSWSIVRGPELAQFYSMPQPGQALFTMTRAYYDVHEQLFLLDMAALKHSKKAKGQVTSSSQIVYVIRPQEKKAHWLRTLRQEDAFSDDVFGIPYYSEKIFLSSSMLRYKGKNAIYAQPFGTYKLRLHIKEQPYSKSRKGPEKLGRGFAALDVLDPSGAVVFSLHDNYTDNSKEYTGYWSPDGHYLFFQLPAQSSGSFMNLESLISNSFLIIGPFPTTTNPNLVLSQLEERRTKKNEALRDEQFRRGEITAAERYGSVFLSTQQRIMHCPAVRKITGGLEKVFLRSPADVLDFGNPGIVGKHFIFSYRTPEGLGGRIEATALFPKNAEEEGDKYKNYLESVTIQTDSDTYDVLCP